MNIVLVGPAYPFRGGIAHYLALLYVALKEKGHRVSVLSLIKQYPKLLFPGKSQEEPGGAAAKVEATRMLSPMGPLTWVRTAMEIRRRRADLVIFKYWMPFFAISYCVICLLTRSWTRAKILYICHNIVPHEKKPGDLLLTKLALRFVDYFLVMSDAVQADVLRFRPDAVFRQVPHPVYDFFSRGAFDREASQAKLDLREERVILFFGYIRAYKGLMYLIDAMPEILDRMDLRLLVVGEFYDDPAPYMDRIERLGIGEKVTVVDSYVPNEEVGTYFSAADVVVLPYVSATQSGIVQIAYAFDTPVIITEVGGLPEVVLDGKTGLVVPPEDSHRLAQAILRFYDEELAKSLSVGVRTEKRRYSWDRLVQEIEALASFSEDQP